MRRMEHLRDLVHKHNEHVQETSESIRQRKAKEDVQVWTGGETMSVLSVERREGREHETFR